MDKDDTKTQHLVKRSLSESEDGDNDDGLRSVQEMGLEKWSSRDPKDAPLVRLDGASELLKEMRLMQREKESRELEKEVRRRTEEVLERERLRLEEDIKAEREDARWRREAEEKVALEREKRVREWEDKVIGEVMRREEELRTREREFMAHWELERRLAKERALKFEKAVMVTEREIQALSLQMANGSRQGKKQDIKDAILLLMTFFLFAITLLYMINQD